MVKSDGPKLSLSEAVSQAAKSAGVTPISAPNALQGDLEKPELQEAYSEQVPCGKMYFHIMSWNKHMQTYMLKFL